MLRDILAYARYWLPLLAGVICVVIAGYVGPIAAWILLIASFGFLLEGATAMWEHAGGTGNLWTHRQ